MSNSEDDQQRAERDAASLEVLGDLLIPKRVRSRPQRLTTLFWRVFVGDPFLIPSLLIMCGLISLLHIGEWMPGADGHSAFRGSVLLRVATLAANLAVILAVSHLLRRILAIAHGVSPRFAWSITGCALLGLVIANVGLTYYKSAQARTHEAAVAEIMQARLLANRREQSEHAHRAQAERETRTALIERWRLARRTVINEWRKNLSASGALGGAGVKPPMLDVQDTGSLVIVTNRAADSVCVLVMRTGANDAGALERCTVGGNRCVAIRGGETARLQTLRAGNPPGCLAGPLEFRVGNVDYPEPSWWSESAFAEFASTDPDPEFVDRWSSEYLLAEIEKLERQARDHVRVER